MADDDELFTVETVASYQQMINKLNPFASAERGTPNSAATVVSGAYRIHIIMIVPFA